MTWISAHAGELAALGTATCWTFSSLAWEVAGRRIGALALNPIRLVMGLVLLTALAWVWRGRPLPDDVPATAWGWLAVSGLVGFVFGDFCLFRALNVLGARLTMLIQTTAPAMAALIAWPALGERPGAREIGGMALTAAGVAWATTARRREAPAEQAMRRADAGGVVMALGGALGQAGGLVLAKIGMAGAGARLVHPVAATQVRALAGVAGFVVVLSLVGWWPRIRNALRDRRAMAAATIGSLFGPAVGVSLSLYAVARTQAGIAASLMALTPVLLLPVAAIRREPLGFAAIAGALLAVAGVTLLV